MLQDLLLTNPTLQTCYECNWQKLTFDEDEHLIDDPQPECELLETTKTMKEEKNCERKQEFKETMSIMAITKLEGGVWSWWRVSCSSANLEIMRGDNEQWSSSPNTTNPKSKL